MFKPLDGPSLQGQENVSSTVVFQVKTSTSELKDRQVVTIMPLDGKIWVYFGDNNLVPTSSDVKAKGFPHFTNSMRSYEAGGRQEIYIVADAGTVDVRFSERS